MTAAERSGFEAAKADVLFIRWIFGWNLVVGWGMVTFLVGGVGYFIGFPYLFGLLGFVAGLPIWYQGTGYINEHYEAIRDGYVEDVETYGPKVLQAAGAPETAEFVTLISWPEDTPLFLETPPGYSAAVLAIGAERLWIYDETALDLQFLSATLGTDTDEVEVIEIADLETVEFADRVLTIEQTDGTEHQLRCAEEPIDAITTIRARMYAAGTGSETAAETAAEERSADEDAAEEGSSAETAAEEGAANEDAASTDGA